MADETIVTNIVANADFSNLIADVHKVTASLSQLQEKLGSTNKTLANQIAVMNRTFSETMRSTGQFSTHFVSLTSDVEKFGRNLDSGKLKLKDYFRTWQEHTKTSGGLIRQLAQQQVQLQNAVLQPLGRNAQGLMQFNVHVPRGLDNVRNKTALAKQELQIMNKVIQDGGVQLINWGKNTQWAGRQLTVGLTVPMAAFGKTAADAFRQADEQLTRLTKVYGGLTATSSTELMKVRKDVAATARELASGYGASFKDTLSLAADIAATGKTGNELLGSVKETTRLAVLGEVDRQDAMKATLAIQSAFKQNTEQLSESINFLNAVENQTSTSLGDLIEAIPKAGPVVEGLGGSVKDLALYLTAMKEGGVNASEGANALKSALASLINPTKVATEMFAGFGIDLKGIVTQNAGDLTGTLLNLQKALDTLNPLQKQQALEQLFGKFQFARMNALFENLGRQGSQTLQVLDLMKASSQDLASIAGRELSMVTESASGRYKRALESLRADLATVGENFLNISTNVINFVDRIISAVDKLPKPIKQALTLVGGITALAGPIIMLTGVLANFFGYIVKGLGHFKALFKGGEGFKLLTPEILAAQKAGTMMEGTFYSDAKAATILTTAVRNLNDELILLQQRVTSGQVSAQPVFSRVGEGLAVMGGPRVVDPSHPLAGDLTKAPRASAHMNPRNPGEPATIFGLVPSAEPVNRRIGRTPMMYMNERLPNVEGLTSVGGISTGVVAGEAARYHALMATLGMQSKQEIEGLKKTIAIGGAVSSDFINTFDDILPLTTALTQKAAQESAQIVAQLRQGKLTVENARAQIMALNAEIERQMGLQVTEFAAQRGRTIDLSKAPLIDQPVVNAQGKSNLRGMFRKGVFGKVMSAVGRATRTRTFGAPYNIEVTKPTGFKNGGVVYLEKGGNEGLGRGRNRISIEAIRSAQQRFGSLSPELQDQVLSTRGFAPQGTDTIPAMLSPGEFVVRASSVTPETLPFLQALNQGGPEHLSAQMLWQTTALNQGLEGRGVGGNAPMELTGRNIASSYRGLRSVGLPPVALLYDAGKRLGYDPARLRFHLNNYEKALTQKLASYGNKVLTKQELELIQENLLRRHAAQLFRISSETGRKINFFEETALMGSRRLGGQGGTGFIGGLTRTLLGTSSGFSGRQNEAHLITAQELLDNPQYSMSGNNLTHIPTGNISTPRSNKMTLTKMFGVQKGHLGSKFWGTAAQIARRLVSLRSGNRLGFAGGGLVPKVNYLHTGTDMPLPESWAMQLQQPTLASQMFGAPKQTAGQAFRAGVSSGNIFKNGMIKNIRPMGFGAQMGIGLAGGIAGQMIGGPAGMAVSAASNILPMMTMLKGFGGVLPSITKIAGLLGRLTIPGATIAALGLATKLLLDWKKRAEEAGKANRLAFGGTQDTLAEVGLKYTSINDKLKAVNEQLALQKAKGLEAYAALTSSGVPGLTLTIKELSTKIEEAKTKAKETVSAFNAIDSSKVTDLAASLKQQYISAGMSVQEATNQIYAIIKASDKGDMALSAITSKAFIGIKDKASAAEYSVKALAKTLSDKNLFNAEEFARGVDNMLNSIETYRQSLAGTKQGDKTVSQAEALKQTLEKIKTINGANNQLSQDAIKGIQQQNMVLGSVLGKAETLAGVYAKMALMQSGFGGNLLGMSSDDAVKVAMGMQAYSDAVTKVASDTKGPLSSIAAAYNKAKNAADASAKNAKKSAGLTSDSIDAEIKKRQKLIDSLKKEEDARLKLLDAQQKQEDFNTSIKQAQIAYQEALAAGDMAQAAQEQLNIQKLTEDRQRELSRTAIQDKYENQIAKLQAEIDKLQEKKNAQQNAAAGAQTKATNDLANAMTIKSYMDRFSAAAQKYPNIDSLKGDEKKAALGEVAQIFADMKKEGGAIAKYAEELRKQYSTSGPSAITGKVATTPEAGILKSLSSKGFELAGVGEFKEAVGLFKEYVVKLTGSENPKLGTGLGGKTTGQARTQGYVDVMAPKGGTVVTEYGKKYIYDNSGNKHLTTSRAGKAVAKALGVKLQSGGFISGPGTGTSDSIPAMLSNGEYVVNARSVAAVGIPTLDSINKMAQGGPVFARGMSGYSTGGRYKFAEGTPGGLGTSNALYNINVTLNGTDLSPDDVAKAIDKQMRMREAMNGRSRNF